MDRNEIGRQMVEFASYVPEEIEEALVEASDCSGY